MKTFPFLRHLSSRELSYNPRENGFEVMSEYKAATSDYKDVQCKLPSTVRSTFLTAFSTNGKLVASTHGDHNIYICSIADGKLRHTLKGHPRTPWCLAFHPSSNDILASGCLGGQVRVWDLNGASEVWTSENQTVITSLSFHPLDTVLLIATHNRIHFWDWKKDIPFATCHTLTEKEKVRYVKFNPLGTSIITGITNTPESEKRTLTTDEQQPSSPRTVSNRQRHRPNIFHRLLSFIENDELSLLENASGGPSVLVERARQLAEMFLFERQNMDMVQNPVALANQEGFYQPSSDEPNPGFWNTLQRLRSICRVLECQLDQHVMDTSRSNQPSTSNFTSQRPPSSSSVDLTHSLRSLLMRLEASLGMLSHSAATSEEARTQIEELRHRIRLIVRRLRHLPNYRPRVANLRYEIYEMAQRVNRRDRDSNHLSSSSSETQEEAHFGWFMEMCLMVIRQMQRYLIADRTHEEPSEEEPPLVPAPDAPTLEEVALSTIRRRRAEHLYAASLNAEPLGQPARRYDALNPLYHANVEETRQRRMERFQASRLRMFENRRHRQRPEEDSSSDEDSNVQAARSLLALRRRGYLQRLGTRLNIPEIYTDPFLPSPPEERSRSPPTEQPNIPNYISFFYETGLRPRYSSSIFGVYDNMASQTHRIQCWDFSRFVAPNLSKVEDNVVVPLCKIHNDASVDISTDGRLIAVLVPLDAINVAVYSLDPCSRGQKLFATSVGSNALSVSLSPLANFVIVGLTSVYLYPAEQEAVAQIYKLQSEKEQGHLQLVKKIYQPLAGFNPCSLNSIRWLPLVGQGLVYGTNRGNLTICHPCFQGESKIRSSHPVSASTQTSQPQTQTTGTQTLPQSFALMV